MHDNLPIFIFIIIIGTEFGLKEKNEQAIRGIGKLKVAHSLHGHPIPKNCLIMEVKSLFGQITVPFPGAFDDVNDQLMLQLVDFMRGL